MIETKTYYDPETGDFTVEYKNNLLIDYMDIMSGLMMKEKTSGVLPGNARIERIAENRVNLVLGGMKERMKEVSSTMLQIPTEIAESINRIFNEFAREALTKKSISYEIIPLKGYAVEDIKKDISSMLAKSRDLCVITDYRDWLKSRTEKADKVSFVQATFKYLSDDYCNIVIAAQSGNMTEVQALVKDKLKKTDWM